MFKFIFQCVMLALALIMFVAGIIGLFVFSGTYAAYVALFIMLFGVVFIASFCDYVTEPENTKN